MKTSGRKSKKNSLEGFWGAVAPGRVTPVTDAELLAESRFRARGVFVGIAIVMALLTVRAGWVMGVPDERLERHGREQFRFAVELRGRRGAIVDRQGRVLAATVKLPSLYANPARIAPEAVEARLAAITAATGKEVDWVRARFEKRNGRLLQEVKLGASLDPDAAKAIVAGLPRDQMWLVQEPVRVYPGRDLAAPLLGLPANYHEPRATT